ncbi:MAG: NCS2 family permease [Gammaproteobacteria bacterium]|nr:NCS2 family permease [Gammaproteobacteria bacterium]
MPWFVRGDVDGFFGLALDNLVQLLVIVSLCKSVLGFPDALLYGRVLPGAAVSLLVGNLFYAWQARRLAVREGRTDVCALPYGINTVSLFAYVFLVMLPAKAMATAAGAADPARVAWQAGLLACFGSGLIELGGSLVAERVRRITPRAALLSTLAGIALGFISLGFLYRTYAHPVVGLSTLAVILLTYFGRVHFRGGLPGGLVAVALGTALSWILGIAPTGAQPPGPSLALPLPVASDLLQALRSPQVLTYLSVIIPMGLFNVIGSLQNIESAEAAGDSYPTAPSLAVNGTGTLLASLFGSCFPTTLYIGHPGWKAMGARAGYSILNGAILSTLIFTGTLSWLVWSVPVDAGMAIVLWIGIVISAQAFQAVPRTHAPAVVLGLLPGIGAWGALMIKDGLRAAGYGAPDGPAFSADLVPVFQRAGVWADGAFALEQGFILTAMILAATTVFVIERHFAKAAFVCLLAAALSSTGLMHGYRWTASDTVLNLAPAWPWAIAYAAMALCFFAAKWVAVPDDADASGA